ncbi:MAG: alanine racemase, partial [Proteobacteria bacterium]|nr:alanine racemase [Pseudomonadota bacterium]
VSASAAAQVGDIVEMWGGDIATEQLAADAGTIPHELLSHLGPRVELRFI